MTRSRTRALGIAALLVLAMLSPANAQTTEPALGFYTDTGATVAALDTTPISTYLEPDFMSLGGNVFASARENRGGRNEHITAFDATSGEAMYRIESAQGPVVLADGAKIAFWPDPWGNRDPYGTSVWMRNAQGNERRIFQLTGPRATVPRDPFQGDAVPLSMAFDQQGKWLAIAMGNDIGLRIFDIWVVNVKTREATRVTRGKESHWPSLSPSGARLAHNRENVPCVTADGFPFDAWNIVVMDRNGENAVTLFEGACDSFYSDPRWISETEFVAVRVDEVAPNDYMNTLVRVDADTGDVEDLVDDVGYFSASPSLQKVAFHRATDFQDPGGRFWVYDLTTGDITEHPDGYIPRISGESRLI